MDKPLSCGKHPHVWDYENVKYNRALEEYTLPCLYCDMCKKVDEFYVRYYGGMAEAIQNEDLWYKGN